MDNNVE